MKKIAAFVILAVMVLCLLTGCGKSKVGVTVTSAKVVNSFTTPSNVLLQSDLGTARIHVNSNGITHEFPEREIIRVDLDCRFIGVAEGLENGSDEQKKEIYNTVKESATFTVNGEIVEPVWGYWPKKTSRNSAEQLTMLFLIPEGQSLDGLKIVFNGAALGDVGYTYEFTDFTR